MGKQINEWATKIVPKDSERTRHYNFFYDEGKASRNGLWVVKNEQKKIITVQAKLFTEEEIGSMMEYISDNNLGMELHAKNDWVILSVKLP